MRLGGLSDASVGCSRGQPRLRGSQEMCQGEPLGGQVLGYHFFWKLLVGFNGLWRTYVREYPQKIWPYMVHYLHFRILKFPLIGMDLPMYKISFNKKNVPMWSMSLMYVNKKISPKITIPPSFLHFRGARLTIHWTIWVIWVIWALDATTRLRQSPAEDGQLFWMRIPSRPILINPLYI